MEFSTYLEIRQLYNSKKDSLSPEQLQEMIKALGYFYEMSISGPEKELIDDLIDDIEIWIDTKDEARPEAESNSIEPECRIIHFIAPSF